MATALPSRVLSLLLLAASSTLAQQPTAPPQTSPGSSTLTLKVNSRLTVEDVTVTDAAGKPVYGLAQSDFTVKEDGKPQEIKNFQEYGMEQTQAAPLQLPPNVYTNQQTTVPSAVNILLFDDASTGLAGGLSRSSESLMLETQQAIKYLKTMPAGTQVAILKLTSGVHVVQGFTSERDRLLAAVNSLLPEVVPGTYVDPPPPRPAVEDFCRAMNAQSQTAVDALTAIAGFVSEIKGRKNLIWFTPGIPWLTNGDIYQNLSASLPCLVDYSPELHKAYGLLAAARVAAYPVDPRGLRGAGSFGPMKIGSSFVGAPTSADLMSMQDIAKSTGGVPFYSRNDLDAAIGEAIAMGADYYSLSYVPPLSKSDGKYHTIDVKVDRPGLQLKYREGYTGLDVAPPKPDKKSPTEAVSQPVSEFSSAMAHGQPDATGLLFAVSVLPAKSGNPSNPPVIGSLNPKLKGKHLVRYNFAYALPAGEITLGGNDPSGARSGSFEIAVVAYNADGELLNKTVKTTTFTFKADQAEQFVKQPTRLDVQLDLPPGKVFLRVGVLDVPSEKMGILEIPQTVDRK
jgi:VWFA-related protein